MRLFVAVELSEAIRAEASRVARELADALGQGSRRAVSWAAPANMHLTVRFVGEVEPGTARELARRIGEPLAAPAFRLAVGGLGAFPHAGPPRIIWLGVTEGGERLAEVHDEVERLLVGLGLPPDDRPFRAHLTLGRVRTPLGLTARQALASVHAGALGACGVSEVTLFESRLSPRGSTYMALARGRLAGS
jgi:2'-5' RNA ligase